MSPDPATVTPAPPAGPALTATNAPGEPSLYWWWARVTPYPPMRVALLLGLLGGLLLGVAWPPSPVVALLGVFVGYVPLLIAGEVLLLAKGVRRGWAFWLSSYLGLLTFNLLATWWIVNSTLAGAAAAIILNAALMTLPLVGYYLIRRRVGLVAAVCALPLMQVLFEWGHLSWDLTWPWLTLGNALMEHPDWVQWYEWTGHLGGTAWIMWLNVILFLGFCKQTSNHGWRGLSWATAAWLLPVTVSLCMLPWAATTPAGVREHVVAAQPNIDPYREKFRSSPDFVPYEEQLARAWRVARDSIRPELTRWVLMPETTIDALLDERYLATEPLIVQLQDSMAAYTRLRAVLGATTYRVYPAGQPPAGARYTEGLGWYDVYNTALSVGRRGEPIEVYHKSKLVPGVEGMPYPAVVGPLTALVIDLGGTAGGLGRQPTRGVFAHNPPATATPPSPGLPTDPERQLAGAAPGGVAPAVCYESVFGDFMGGFVRQGAGWVAVITNDGWWGDTPGHVQHLHLARLRAVESRRWVVRSANTGISAVIDPLGRILKSHPYGYPGAVTALVDVRNDRTLYSYIGDAGLAALLAVLSALAYRWRSAPGRFEL